MAAVTVNGLPKIDTEKSEQTKLNKMMFIGVQSCEIYLKDKLNIIIRL